ncbi:MAG TPA: SDR family NAD(P)-dependent oxidoreductase, partial [Gemmataceae bacterium]|nr:SDR family NAD(P)-dependent oxidoreductase [Gemmataceae bacterium]
PEEVRQRCPREFSRAACYDYLRTLGLDYGPLFQGIERVWQGERESLGLVQLPDALVPAGDEYLFHPALLDACLQVVIPADGDFNQRDGGLYLPFEIEQVRIFRRPGRRVWVHARLLEKTPRWSVAEVDVYDEAGRPVVRVRGLRSQRVAGGREESLDDLLYAYRWRAQPRPEADRPAEGSPLAPRVGRHSLRECPATSGRWLLFADEAGVARRLAEELRARGDACTLVFAGPAFEECGEDQFRIHPGRPEDMLRIVHAFVEKPGFCGIVHLWNLNAPVPDELTTSALAAAQEAGLLSVVHLIQAWDRVAPDQSARLYLVTRGAQSVGEVPEPTAVAQSPVIGLGRVIAGEYPRLRCKLVDLDPLTLPSPPAAGGEGRVRGEDANTLSSLLEEILLADDDEDEVALRGTERFVHRFLPAPPSQKPGFLEKPGFCEATPYRLTTRRPGTLDGLTLQTLRRRPPGPGEVEIEVFAAGLNFSDVMKALGLYPGLPDGPVPFGAECSGVVTAVGEGVAGLRVGDEVLAVAGFAFGSHVVTRAELVARKPARLSFEEAAALPIAFLTAAYALEHLGRLGKGESVLIHSASGGVGLAAVQLARRAGAEVFATAGTPEKRDYLRALGIRQVMDSRSLAFADEVRQLTGGRGVDAVLNSLPGEAIPRGLAALADYGRFLEIGKRDIYQNARLGLQPFRKNLSFFAIDLDRVMRERPALLGSLLQEIVRRVDGGELQPLPCRAWPITEAADAFRFMQHGKHVGKVVLTMRNQPVAAVPNEDEPIPFRADASYLITGGLGGFGLAVARWMAERGARNLVLVSRHAEHALRGAGAGHPLRAAIAELEQLGARVVVRSADVSKEEDVAAVLAEIDRDLPPLRGIMHAAMVLEDALLTNLDRDLMGRVLAPKVSGTWNLHTQTLDRPLDLFVLFSSLSSVFGHAGQGNYAAANAFLDALAWHRRARGLPALTVNWGYLGEVGYLAQRAELGGRLERQGVLSFTVRQALTLLERALLRQYVQVSVMRVEWSRWRGLGVTGKVSPRFAHLCQMAGANGAAAPANGLPGRDAIRAAGPDERRNLLDLLLRDKVARVLGADADRLDRDTPLLHLGLDSLMAVELRNWIEGELDVNLPIVELMRSPSVARLTELLLEQFGKEDDHGPVAARVNGSAARANGTGTLAAEPAELLTRVEELSGEQVDALLAALLQEKDTGAG